MTRAVALLVSERRFKLYAPHRFQSRYGGAYGYLVTLGALHIMAYSKDVHAGRVAYVIERGHKGEPYIDQVFRRVVANPQLQNAYLVDSHTWVGKDDIRTHPADLLSHEAASWAGGETSPAWEKLNQFAHVFHYQPEHFLEQVADINAAERRHKTKRGKQ